MARQRLWTSIESECVHDGCCCFLTETVEGRRVTEVLTEGKTATNVLFGTFHL